MAQKKPAQKEEVEVEVKAEVKGKKGPVHRIPVGGGIKVIVWDNGNGDRHQYTYELVRTYKTENGLVDTDKLWCNHLLFASAAMLRAHNWHLDQQDAARADDAKSK